MTEVLALLILLTVIAAIITVVTPNLLYSDVVFPAATWGEWYGGVYINSERRLYVVDGHGVIRTVFADLQWTVADECGRDESETHQHREEQREAVYADGVGNGRIWTVLADVVPQDHGNDG